jgi:hypothetical protein
MAHDVFVSYSSKDKQTADTVCAALESKAIRCWVAPRDIRPGADWAESIMEAIRGSRVMVLVFSKNANESVQIKREVERAIHHGIPVIPLRVENVLPSGAMEYSISTAHWLDAFTPPLERHLNYLADVVRAILDGKPKPRQTPPRSLTVRWSTRYAAGAVVILLLVLLVLRRVLFPPSITGNWNLTQCSLIPGTSTPRADLLSPALTGEVTGQLQLSPLNKYSFTITGADSGTVMIDPNGHPDPSGQSTTIEQLTFTSNATHKPITLTGMWLPVAAGAPAGNVMMYLSTGSQDTSAIAATRLAAADDAGSPGPERFYGSWDFKGLPPNFLWSGTLTIKSDGTYLVNVTHSETDIVDAKDGVWELTDHSHLDYAAAVGAGLFSSGHYSFSGSNTLRFASAGGNFTFSRAE